MPLFIQVSNTLQLYPDVVVVPVTLVLLQFMRLANSLFLTMRRIEVIAPDGEI